MLASYGTDLLNPFEVELSAICEPCAPGAPANIFAVQAFHVLAGGNVAVSYQIRPGGAEEPIQYRLLLLTPRLQRISDTLVATYQTSATFAQPFHSSIAPAGNVFFLVRTCSAGLTCHEVLEVNPATGGVDARPLPDDYQPPDLYDRGGPILFDSAGNRYLFWVDVGDKGVRLASFDKDSALRYDHLFAAGSSNLQLTGAVSLDGRLIVVANGTGAVASGTALVMVGADGELAEALDTGVFSGRLECVNALGQSWVREVLVSATGDRVEDSLEFPFSPVIALTDGRYLRGGSFYEPGGRFPFVKSSTVLRRTIPSATGLFAIGKTFDPGRESIRLQHWKPASRYMIEDAQPLELTLAACAGACPAIPLAARFDLRDALSPSTATPRWFVSRGGGSVACIETSPDDPLTCRRYGYRPGDTPGLAIVESAVTGGVTAEAANLWRTGRLFRVVEEDGSALTVDPSSATISPGEEISVTASSVARWTVLSGFDLLAAPIDEVAGKIFVHAAQDAANGVVRLLADDLAGNVRFANIFVRNAPRLLDLAPSPNLEISVLRLGGAAYRYYRLIEGQAERPDELAFPDIAAELAVTGTSIKLLARGTDAVPESHRTVMHQLADAQPGLFVLKIPYSLIAAAVDTVPKELTMRLVAFHDGDLTLPVPETEQVTFTLRVVGRDFDRGMAFGSGVVAGGIPLVKLVGAGHGSLGETGSLATPGDAGSFVPTERTIGDYGDIGLGLGLDLFEGELAVGPVGFSAGLETKLFIRHGRGEEFRFDLSPGSRKSVDAQNIAAARAVKAATGLTVGGAATNFVREFVEIAEAALFGTIVDHEAELSPFRSHLIESVALQTVPIDFSLNLKLGSKDDEGEIADHGFIELSLINVAYSAALEVLYHGLASDLPVGRTATWSVGAELELAAIDALGFSLCLDEETCQVGQFSVRVRTDIERSLDSFSLSVVDDTAGLQKTWTARGEDAMEIVQRGCNSLPAVLGFYTECTDCPVCPGENGVELNTTAFPQDVFAATFGELQAGREVTWEQRVKDGGDTGLTFGVQFGIGLKTNVSKEVDHTSTVVSGVALGGALDDFFLTELPLEEYTVPDDFVSAAEDDDVLSEFLGSTLGRLRSLTDGDGLSDGAERGTHDTDPRLADTDGDGLDDGAELSRGTDPRQLDSDGDGLSDGAEVTTYGSDPLVIDSDGDGVDDGRETSLGTNPAAVDSDGDAVGDLDELLMGTSAVSPDTDGDGASDGIELALGTNPLDAASKPSPADLVPSGGAMVLVLALVFGASWARGRGRPGRRRGRPAARHTGGAATLGGARPGSS